MYSVKRIYPLEFLTSLWEMWTAAQGWGSPRQGEAGWDIVFLFPSFILFRAFVLKCDSFQKGALKAAISPRLHLKKSLKDLLSVLNWGVENSAASDVCLKLYVCVSLLLIWNVFFTVFWQPLWGSRGICFREKWTCRWVSFTFHRLSVSCCVCKQKKKNSLKCNGY